MDSLISRAFALPASCSSLLLQLGRAASPTTSDDALAHADLLSELDNELNHGAGLIRQLEALKAENAALLAEVAQLTAAAATQEALAMARKPNYYGQLVEFKVKSEEACREEAMVWFERAEAEAAARHAADAKLSEAEAKLDAQANLVREWQRQLVSAHSKLDDCAAKEEEAAALSADLAAELASAHEHYAALHDECTEHKTAAQEHKAAAEEHKKAAAEHEAYAKSMHRLAEAWQGRVGEIKADHLAETLALKQDAERAAAQAASARAEAEKMHALAWEWKHHATLAQQDARM